MDRVRDSKERRVLVLRLKDALRLSREKGYYLRPRHDHAEVWYAVVDDRGCDWIAYAWCGSHLTFDEWELLQDAPEWETCEPEEVML